MLVMQKKKQSKLAKTFNKIFHRRNIIILSEKGQEHIPLGSGVQFIALTAVIGLFSLISFTTGSYMSAQSVLDEKDRQLFSSSLQNQKIDEEYSLLKRDLLKLKEKHV